MKYSLKYTKKGLKCKKEYKNCILSSKKAVEMHKTLTLKICVCR